MSESPPEKASSSTAPPPSETSESSSPAKQPIGLLAPAESEDCSFFLGAGVANNYEKIKLRGRDRVARLDQPAT